MTKREAGATLSETRWGDGLLRPSLIFPASGVSEHIGTMRVGLCTCYDRLRGAELACTELLARRAQMVEHKYKDWVVPVLAKDMDAFL